MNTESKLREALRRVKHEAVSLADAQVIALEALAQPSPPEQVERAGLVDELIRCAGRRDVLHYGYMGKMMDEKTYAEFTELRDVRVPQLRAALAAQPATAPAQDPCRPDILERLTYHRLERDDLTLGDVLEVLANGWKMVRGRTERQMLIQMLDLMASQPEQQQAGAVVSDAPKYRLLQRNVDMIEATDEFLAEDAETWAIDPNGIFVGNTYGGMVLRPARRAVLAQEEGQVPKHSDKQDDHDPAVTVESFLIQHPRRSGTVEVVTAADHEGAVFAARLRERERLRGYFLDALADKGIVWPGEVDILYDKCFAGPTPGHSPGNMAQPIHDPAVTTPREVLVGESPVDRIAAPAQEQPKSDAQIILDIITLFERRPEFKAAFREEWLRYTGVEQQQAGAVVSDEQISNLWLMSVDCVGLSRDKAISFARAVLALSQGGKP